MINPYFDPERENPYLGVVDNTNPYLADVVLQPEVTPAPVLNEAEKAWQRGIGSFGPYIDRTQAAFQGALGFDAAAQANLEEARRAELYNARPEIAAKVPRFTDIGKTGNYLSDTGNWLVSSVVENAPLLASMALTGGAGALAGSLRTGSFIANRAAAAAAGMAPYFIQTTGENSQNIMDDPTARGTLQEKSIGTLAGGAAQTALGAAPIHLGLAQILKPGVKLGQRLLRATGVGAIGEGTTEAGEEAVKKVAGGYFSPDNPANKLNTEQAWLDYLNAGAAGAVVGGLTSGGGALASHPFLAKAAQRHAQGVEDFVKQHSVLFSPEDVATLRQQNLPQLTPSSPLEAKMWDIENRDNLGVAYQELVGMSPEEYQAQRRERIDTLNNIAKTLWASDPSLEFKQGNPRPDDPLYKQVFDDPEVLGIMRNHISQNAPMWEEAQRRDVLHKEVLNSFTPEERTTLDFMQGLAKETSKSPVTSNLYRKAVAENKGLLDEYDRRFADLSQGTRDTTPIPGFTDQKMTHSPFTAEEDEPQDTNPDEATFTDAELNPGYSVEMGSSNYLSDRLGRPWKGLNAIMRDNPTLDQSVVRENARRRDERVKVAQLPVAAQEEYAKLYDPLNAAENYWKNRENSPEKTQALAEARATTQASIDQWRAAREDDNDELGNTLRRVEVKPVSLLSTIEEEYGLDTRKPEDALFAGKLIKRIYLTPPEGKTLAPELQKYQDKPLQYGLDYELLDRPTHPKIISGLDEFTPTQEELKPKPDIRVRSSVAQSRSRLAKTNESLAGSYSWRKNFTPEELGVIGTYDTLNSKIQDSQFGDPKVTQYRQQRQALLDQHGPVLSRAFMLSETRRSLEEEASDLQERIKRATQGDRPIIVDRPNEYREQKKIDAYGSSELTLKRIPIQEYNPSTGKWVPKAIDPMELVVSEMTRKKNFSASPDTFTDNVASAFFSGLAGILSDPKRSVKLDGALNPDAIIYSRRNGGMQLRLKDLEVKGAARYRLLMDSLKEKYAMAKDDENRAAIRMAAELTKKEMRLTSEGAKIVRDDALAKAEQKWRDDPKALERAQKDIDFQFRQDLGKIAWMKSNEEKQTYGEWDESSSNIDNPDLAGTPLPLNQSAKWVDDMAREPGPYAPDERAPLYTEKMKRWAPYAQEGQQSYELSKDGDARFSHYKATFKRPGSPNVDTVYKQAVAKSPRQLSEYEKYDIYKNTWKDWVAENPEAFADLDRKTGHGNVVLTDKFMSKGSRSPARVFAELLQENRNQGITQEVNPPSYAPPAISVVEGKDANYPQRTARNAGTTDVTVAFAADYTTAGERLTQRVAGDKIIQWDGTGKEKLFSFAERIASKLKESGGRSLNIAGNGMQTWAKYGKTQEEVNAAMFKVLGKVKELYPDLERVVTGGQTGSDIAGAIAARALGIPVEVNMPKGFKQRNAKGFTTYSTASQIQTDIETAANILVPKQQQQEQQLVTTASVKPKSLAEQAASAQAADELASTMQTAAAPPAATQKVSEFGTGTQYIPLPEMGRDLPKPKTPEEIPAQPAFEGVMQDTGAAPVPYTREAAGKLRLSLKEQPSQEPPTIGQNYDVWRYPNGVRSQEVQRNEASPSTDVATQPPVQVTPARAETALYRLRELSSLYQGFKNDQSPTLDARKTIVRTMQRIAETGALSPELTRRLTHFTLTTEPNNITAAHVQDFGKAIHAELTAPITPADQEKIVKYATVPGATQAHNRTNAATPVQVEERRTRHQQVASMLMPKLGITTAVEINTLADAHTASYIRNILAKKAKSKQSGFGGFAWTDKTGYHVFINPDLSEEGAVEVLGHELGHVVYREAYSKATVEQVQAIEKDFNAWRDNIKGSTPLRDIYQSKLQHHFFMDVWDENNQRVFKDLTPKEQKYVADFEEWFSDNVSKWMVTEATPRTILQQFFHRIGQVMRNLYFSLSRNRSASSVRKFMNDMAMRQRGPNARERAMANQEIRSGLDLVEALTPEEHKAFKQAMSSGPVRTQLYKLASSDPFNTLDVSDPDAAVLFGFEKWLSGDLNLSKNADTLAKKAYEQVREALGFMDPIDQAAAILDSFTSNNRVGFVMPTALNKNVLQRTTQRMDTAARKIKSYVFRALPGNSELKAMNDPSAFYLAEKIFKETNQIGEEGLLAGRYRQYGYFENILHNIFNVDQDTAMGERILDIMHKKVDIYSASPEEKKAAVGIYSLLERMYNYARKYNPQMGLRGAEITVDIDGKPVTVRDYFPRIFNEEYMQQHKDEFIAMLMQPKYRADVKDVAEAEIIYRSYIDHFAKNELPYTPGSIDNRPTGFLARREYAFIEDKDLEPFLNKNLGESMVQYIFNTVNQTEFHRVFGPGELKSILNSIEDPTNRERATDFVRGIFGLLGEDMNPTLSTLQGWTIAIQNWAILGTSTLSSLADPMGMAVRGDFRVAWEGLKAGMKELIADAKNEKTDLRALAESLGAVENSYTLEALNYQYGSYAIKGMAKRVNDALFKWNLTVSLTRGTRLMALAAAKEFIRKHVKSPNKHSERYLRELGLLTTDVAFSPNGEIKILSLEERDAAEKNGEAEKLISDDKVRAALNQWIDEAILRPDAAMRPIYANDPHYALFFHLKSFAYAFNERILKRVVNEAYEGNYMPLLGLASYAPIMFASMALRSAMRGIDDDKNLTWEEAVQRSGIFGYGQWFLDAEKDAQWGAIPGMSMLDPTSKWAMDTVQAITTPGTKDDIKAFERVLPLQSEWKHWVE